MRADDNRLVGRHSPDQGTDLVLLIGVQPVGRLVQHQHRWIVQQGLRQANAALEAFRQSLDRLQPHGFQPCQADCILHPGQQVTTAKSPNPRDETQQPDDRHVRVGGGALWQEPQSASRGKSVAYHVVPANPRSPGTRRHESASMRIVVDFPAPFGPRNPNTSPRRTENDRSSTAMKRPNRRVRCSISISGESA